LTNGAIKCCKKVRKRDPGHFGEDGKLGRCSEQGRRLPFNDP